MTPSQSDLVREYRYLVVRISRAFTRRARWVSREDAESWALEGLATAAQAFDPSRGIPFEAFAAMKIRWAVLDGYRHERAARSRHGHSVLELSARPGVEPVQTSVTLTGAPAEHLRSTEEDLVRRDDEMARAALVRQLCDALPRNEAAIIRAHYFEDRDLSSIAAATGASCRTVQRHHRVALARLGARIRRAALPHTKVGARGREEILNALIAAAGAA